MVRGVDRIVEFDISEMSAKKLFEGKLSIVLR